MNFRDNMACFWILKSKISQKIAIPRGINKSCGLKMFFVSMMVSIWIAARFSSVAADKGINMVGKIICSLFALGVFMGNWVVGSTVMNSYSGFAKAFEMLGETGVELTPMAMGYIEYFGVEASGMPNPVMMLVGVTGLLIALVPLWFNTSD